MSPVTKILFLTASPSDKAPLQLDEELRQIGQRIRRGGYQHLFSLRSVPGIRATELPYELMSDPPDILHFSGHGSPAGELYFIAGPAERAQPIPGSTLAKLFRQFRDRIKCVVLNACWSTVQAAAIAESIPCVVGLSRAISDPAAIAFAAGFYEALAFGKTVKEAFDLGVIQLELANPKDTVSGSGLLLMSRADVDPATLRLVQTTSEESPVTVHPRSHVRPTPEPTKTPSASKPVPPRSHPQQENPVAAAALSPGAPDAETVRGLGFGALTWLHVSDLHFGHGDAHYRFDQSGVSSAIIRNAESMTKRIGPPDLILVTGDIAFSGQPAQYQQAKEWLGRLMAAVGGTPRIFLVPGNHDVDRKLTMKTSAAALHQVLRAEPRKLDELLHDHTEMQTLWPKLRAYSEFATEVGSPSMSADKPFYVEDVSCRLGGKLRIAGLNTALLSFDNDDSPKNLSLGRGQLLKAIEEQPTDALLLVLEHHPQEWLLDGKALVAQLQQRAHIQFSGHVHNQHGVVHMPLLGGSRLQFVAGAGHKDQSEEGYHSYAWGQFSEEGLAYYSWVWQPVRMAFALATLIDTDDFKRGDHVFVEANRLPRSLQKWLRPEESDSRPLSPNQSKTPATRVVTKKTRKKKTDTPISPTVSSSSPLNPETSGKVNRGVPSAPAEESEHVPVTRASVRKLLTAKLKTDSDSDAFCIDHFPDTAEMFSAGMDRKQKVNLLFQREDLGEIYRQLIANESETTVAVSVTVARTKAVPSTKGKAAKPAVTGALPASAKPLHSPRLDELKENVRKLLQASPLLTQALVVQGYGDPKRVGSELVDSVWASLSTKPVGAVTTAVAKLARQKELHDTAWQLLCLLLPIAAEWQQILKDCAESGGSAVMMELPLQTTTLAEAVMAHLDARHCQFIPGKKYPQGALHLPMPAVAYSSLIDPQGKELNRALRKTVWEERRMGQPPRPNTDGTDAPSERAFDAIAKAEIKASAALDEPRYLLFMDSELDSDKILDEKGELDAAWQGIQNSLGSQWEGLRLVRLTGRAEEGESCAVPDELVLAICVRKAHGSE